MRCIGSLAISFIASLLLTSAEASTQRVALMLSGPSCEADHKALQQDLEKIPGVKAVDLLSLPGFALLDIEAGTADSNELTSAVNRENRLSRQCRAQVMESCISTSQHSVGSHHSAAIP